MSTTRDSPTAWSTLEKLSGMATTWAVVSTGLVKLP